MHSCSEHFETPLANECVIDRQEDGLGEELREQSEEGETEFADGPFGLRKETMKRGEMFEGGGIGQGDHLRDGSSLSKESSRGDCEEGWKRESHHGGIEGLQ